MVIRLVDARLCSNCDTIYDEEQDKVCPACTSPHFVRLKPILGVGVLDERIDGVPVSPKRPLWESITDENRVVGW